MKLHERLAWIRKLPASSTIKAVLWVLADHAQPNGHCFLLQDTIAGEAGMTDRSVRTALRKLRSKAVLTQRHTGKYDHFYLNIELMRAELRSGQVGTTFLHNRPVNLRKRKAKPPSHIAGLPACPKCHKRPSANGEPGEPCLLCWARDNPRRHTP